MLLIAPSLLVSWYPISSDTYMNWYYLPPRDVHKLEHKNCKVNSAEGARDSFIHKSEGEF
jgi:hypothetical protein